MKPSIVFVGKKGDYYCERAVEFLVIHAPETEVILGKRGEPFPRIETEKPDYLFSYLSPWVFPAEVLSLSKSCNINFHPGPPQYPGIGCTNFAIYEQVNEFGITCHHMLPKVDSGEIIAVRRFPLLPADTVYSLTQRCYASILDLFYEISTLVIQGKPLPKSSEQWTRKPFTRKELNDLCRLSPDMDPKEVARRVHAVTFPNAPGAYFEIGTMRFELTPVPSSTSRGLGSRLAGTG